VSVNRILSALLQVIANVPGKAPSTLDPSNKAAAVTLSGGNLSASASGVGAAQSTSFKTTGKWYFEVKYTTLNGSSGAFGGIANTSFSNTSGSGLGGANSAAMWPGSPSILFVNNTNIQSMSPNISAGDVIGFAIDLTNNKMWVNDWTSSSGWIGGGAGANPATNTAGASLSTINSGGEIFAGVGFYTGGGAVTINFGTTSFTGSVPSGFSAWG